MSLSALLRRLAASCRGEHPSADLEAEMRLHLELRARALEERGMDPRQARLAARRRFGSVAAAAAASRDVWMVRWLDRLIQDLRFAARQFRRAPGYTAAAALTLALGIGATAAMFTLVNAVLLRPPPYRDVSSLAALWQSIPQEPRVSFSPAELSLIGPADPAIAAVAAWTGNGFTVTGRGDAFVVRAQMITANLLSMLGVEAHLGRIFGREEAGAGGAQALLLGERIWRQRFGGDPGIVGQPVTMNGRQYSVVGVLPAAFHLSDSGYEVWVPAVLSTGVFEQHRQAHLLRVIARLRPGVSEEVVRSSLAALERRIHEQGDGAERRLHWARLQDDATAEVRRPLLLLQWAVAFVLLIACVNVANLSLARASVRQREIAIRSALGAGRGRIARQLLVESALLASAGGALGLGVALLGLRIFASRIAALGSFGPPAVDPRVVGFTTLLAVVVGFVLGAASAFGHRGDRWSEAVRQGARAGSGGASRRLRAVLAGAEIALSLMLLVAAGLLLRSFGALSAVQTGFEPARVTRAELALPESRYPGAERVLAVHRDLLARLRSVPGIQYAGSTTALPFSGQGWGNTIEAEGRSLPSGKQDVVQAECISPQYLPALGVRLSAGRDFDERDAEAGMPVAILNRSLARRLWPGGESPLGRRVRLDGPWRVVVGVANDVRREQLGDSPEPQIYIPYAQLDPGLMDLIGRGLFLVARAAASQGAPASLAAAIRAQVRAADPELALTRVEPMADSVAQSVAQPRFRTQLIGVFALLALALACVGVYGVMAYGVSQRSREIGVRMALGATAGSILGNVLRSALAVAVAGTAAGCLAALAVARSLRGFLFGVAPTDPLTYASVAALLVALTLLASYVPARRAALVDPVAVLRRDE